MTDQELSAICRHELENAMGFMGGELQAQRAQAMEYYLGEPFGNEEEGRSTVITTDVADTIEWILPSLIRIFCSTDKAVMFEPVGPEDEAQAAQETAVTNHVFYQIHKGFLILYSWFKDALISKNGIVKAWNSTVDKHTRESYRGLNDIELEQLMADSELEAIETEERTIQKEVKYFDPETESEQTMTVDETVTDVVFRRHRPEGLQIEVVIPEEFAVSREANDLDPSKARFCAQRRQYHAYELIDMGYDEDTVRNLAGYGDDNVNEERQARLNLDDENPYGVDSSLHWSMRTIWVAECYIHIDFDGDGITEIRKVTMAGLNAEKQDSILDNEEVDSIPFYAITPTILTHKFYGMSVADAVMDLQLIKSTVLRQMLDNLYLSNNEEKVVVEALVNIDDLLVSRPGGIKRVKGDKVENVQAIQPIQRTFWAGQAFPVLEYLDQIRKERTGVGESVQGLDANTLAQANTGVVNQDYDAARMRIELIARVFAETGVRQLFAGIRECLQKADMKTLAYKIRNEWVQVEPSEWLEKRNTKITVGLGTGNKDQQLVHLMAVYNIQKEILLAAPQNPVVTMKNFYNTLAKLVENAGLVPDQHFTDPAPDGVEQPMQQQQGDPMAEGQLQLMQMQLQIEAAKVKLEEKKLQLQTAETAAKIRQVGSKDSNVIAFDHKKLDADLAKEREKLIVDMEKSAAEMAQKERESLRQDATARYLGELKVGLESKRMDHDIVVEDGKMGVEREKIDETRNSRLSAEKKASDKATQDYLTARTEDVARAEKADAEIKRLSDQHESARTEREAEKSQAMTTGQELKAVVVDLKQQTAEMEKARRAQEQEAAEKSAMILDFLAEEGSDKIKQFVKKYRKVQ